ncbi:MAG: hypothetical protein U0168_27590 [Nannocystaceae bacterium]
MRRRNCRRRWSTAGAGAVLASLLPGNLTYAARDGAYAISAMASLGMHEQARAGLEFYLVAEGGRFAQWDELRLRHAAVPGDAGALPRLRRGRDRLQRLRSQLEFDGFGLVLWAMRNYVEASGDRTLPCTRVADVILALIEPETGLLRPDSSIWETHWNGRQRHWAYTNITAARGLCDAGALAEQMGDDALAQSYREAGRALRAAIAAQLTDPSSALASNTEELAGGGGYADAAVVDAIAMGLFDPTARSRRRPRRRSTPARSRRREVGWSRNDDQVDHDGVRGPQPVGQRLRHGRVGRDRSARRDRVPRCRRQRARRRDPAAGHRADPGELRHGRETYDAEPGTYAFNTPMLGFGAGAYALALAHRGGAAIDPACAPTTRTTAVGSEGGSEGGSGREAQRCGRQRQRRQHWCGRGRQRVDLRWPRRRQRGFRQRRRWRRRRARTAVAAATAACARVCSPRSQCWRCCCADVRACSRVPARSRAVAVTRARARPRGRATTATTSRPRSR